MGVERPEDVRERHVTDFLAGLREGDADHPPLAATSAARTLVAVRGLHRFLALEGVLDADPARRVSPPEHALAAAQGDPGRGRRAAPGGGLGR